MKECKEQVIKFRVTEREKEKIKELAKRSNMTITEYVLYNSLYIYDPNRRKVHEI